MVQERFTGPNIGQNVDSVIIWLLHPVCTNGSKSEIGLSGWLQFETTKKQPLFILSLFEKKFCPLCYSVIVLWPLSHHIVTSAPKFFLTQFLTSFLGTFSPLLSCSPHHINERSIKWLDPLILSLVCKYDMTDYYWSWVKTNLILTLHKIFSFDKVPTVL